MTGRPAIDKQWFIDKLAERGKSLRGLGRHMGLDGSGVSRMFAGQRKMKMQEAGEIASFLGVTVGEVLVHAGVSVELEATAPSAMMLAATINERGTVNELPEPKPLPQAVIERAQATITVHGGDSIIGAQIRATNGPLSVMDDAVVLYQRSEIVDPAAIGVLSVCRSIDGTQFLGKIERARKTGEARLVLATGETKDVELVTATPVLAMIP
jgi:hypothetical protein